MCLIGVLMFFAHSLRDEPLPATAVEAPEEINVEAEAATHPSRTVGSDEEEEEETIEAGPLLSMSPQSNDGRISDQRSDIS